MDRPQANALISDLVRNMDSKPLDWYVDGVSRLAQLMNTSYDQAHSLIMQMRNQ